MSNDIILWDHHLDVFEFDGGLGGGASQRLEPLLVLQPVRCQSGASVVWRGEGVAEDFYFPHLL